MKYDRLAKINAQALEQRPFLNPDYEYRPISTHNRDFQEIKNKYPYYGYIEVKIEGVPPFVMFSNNDDRVAQTYFWYGPNAFESLSLRIWREMVRKSEYVFDIGAFTGVYSMTAALANRNAHICAFEPIKRVFGRTTINLAANRLGGKVKAFDVALSDTDGHMTMNLYQGYFTLSSGSSLVSKRDKEVITREYVETMKFDTFAEQQDIPRMDLAKIDVEQAEKMVVAGMSETLEKHKPNLLIEVVSEENLRELNDTLSPLGYNFAVIDDRRQKIRMNQLEDYNRVDNVLFSAMSPEELEALCRTPKPFPRKRPNKPRQPNSNAQRSNTSAKKSGSSARRDNVRKAYNGARRLYGWIRSKRT